VKEVHQRKGKMLTEKRAIAKKRMCTLYMSKKEDSKFPGMMDQFIYYCFLPASSSFRKVCSPS